MARYAPHGDVVRVVDEALKAAKRGKDVYQQVAVCAWPLRALSERAPFGTLRDVDVRVRRGGRSRGASFIEATADRNPPGPPFVLVAAQRPDEAERHVERGEAVPLECVVERGATVAGRVGEGAKRRLSRLDAQPA